jgi:hypothetical protein
MKRTIINGRRAILSLLIAVFSFLTFMGCESPATSEDNLSSLLEGGFSEGKGAFSLTLSDVARTILPVTPNLNDFAMYNLDFTPTNGGSAENADRTNGTLVTSPVFLDPGTYKLVVNAYKASNKTQLAAQGTLNDIVITAGENTAAAITLEALVSGGTGTFRWEITLPAGVTANMTITPGNTGGANQQTVTLSPPKATGSRTLNSGPYNVTFNLTKTDGKTVVWKELLYVYQSLESVFSFEFTDAHLSESVYTVTFNSNGGEPGEWGQSVLHGAKVLTPAVPTKKWYTLGGWYTDNNTFANLCDFDKPVIESFTLYAKWDLVPLESVTGLAEKLAWLQAHAQSDGNYILEVNANESIGPHTLSYSGRSNIGITLIGTGANRTVSLSSNGSMFTVDSSITLILDNNITLQGRRGSSNTVATGNNNASLVSVNADGALIMNTGAKITGNTFYAAASPAYGGGVYVSGGTFTMNGGTISGNITYSSSSAYGGGGVYISGGTFTMSGGEISGNTGSGVSVFSGGTFIMYDGKISDNTSGSSGGGVTVGGTFTMSGGEISGNTTSGSGGGVYVNGTFIMYDGEISGNTASNTNSSNSDFGGGGVYVSSNATFTMYDGKISGNTASSSVSGNGSARSSGGGVGVRFDATFNMEGGAISGNIATATSGTGSAESYGGGVGGTLTMTGGTITGNTASNGGGVYGSLTMTGGTISSNTASGSGGGVYAAFGLFTMSGGEISGNAASGNGNFSGGGGVYVDSGTSFTMSSGEISGNTADNSGGGVRVRDGNIAIEDGYFTMEGGEISGNTASGTGNYSGGGGVYGSLTMTGGTIPGNTASSYGGGVYGSLTMNGGTISGNTASSGGGVVISHYGTSIMYDGKISGNTASGTGDYFGGGGVYVDSGIFAMEGGEISGNTASSGGGVVISRYGTSFNMYDGKISGNTASGTGDYFGGGGVYVDSGVFVMEGGEISGNTASGTGNHSGGGGVYASSYGRFVMKGGEISGNTASSYGGGVRVRSGTTLDDASLKTGGTITGYAGNTVNGNVVKNSYGTVLNDRGHAVFLDVNDSILYRRETTAGPTMNISNNNFWEGIWP